MLALIVTLAVIRILSRKYVFFPDYISRNNPNLQSESGCPKNKLCLEKLISCFRLHVPWRAKHICQFRFFVDCAKACQQIFSV